MHRRWHLSTCTCARPVLPLLHNGSDALCADSPGPRAHLVPLTVDDLEVAGLLRGARQQAERLELHNVHQAPRRHALPQPLLREERAPREAPERPARRRRLRAVRDLDAETGVSCIHTWAAAASPTMAASVGHTYAAVHPLLQRHASRQLQLNAVRCSNWSCLSITYLASQAVSGAHLKLAIEVLAPRWGPDAEPRELLDLQWISLGSDLPVRANSPCGSPGSMHGARRDLTQRSPGPRCARAPQARPSSRRPCP